jgi:hypothetical protein
MAATNAQVQNYVNERVRPHAELARALALAYDDDIAAIDDVYAALTQATPTWTDARADSPPHLLTPSDVLAINTFMNEIRNAIKNNAQYAIVLKACVRAVNVGA